VKNSRIPGPRKWRMLTALAMIVIGVWVLAGCIYVPTPEQKVGPEKDFRGLTGDPQSNKPIRAGAVTRSQVIAMLGKPTLVSADGRRLGYAIETHTGIGIWPLCFSAGTYTATGYAIRLKFDEQGNLLSYEAKKAEDTPGGLRGSLENMKASALYDFDDDPEFHNLTVLNSQP
jgi:hypothetical protein